MTYLEVAVEREGSPEEHKAVPHSPVAVGSSLAVEGNHTHPIVNECECREIHVCICMYMYVFVHFHFTFKDRTHVIESVHINYR